MTGSRVTVTGKRREGELLIDLHDARTVDMTALKVGFSIQHRALADR